MVVVGGDGTLNEVVNGLQVFDLDIGILAVGTANVMATELELPKAPDALADVLIRGRIGEGWYDIDRKLKLPRGATLGEMLEVGEKKGIPFRDVLENSPHLRDTLMLNGERCPVSENGDREMSDGDELYLLAPLAGG